jgi:uncharacterized phage protein gp47/JayE
MQTDLQNVIDRIIKDFELRTGESANLNVVIEALLNSYGSAAHAIYRYIDNRLEQMFPATASVEWLNLWAFRVGIIRLDDESLDDYRRRIELKLQERNRFGRLKDLAAWGFAYDDIDFTYPRANTPLNNQTTLVLGSKTTLTDERKSQIRKEISAKMHAGAMLFVKQSEPQLIDFEITVATEFRDDISNILDAFITSTNATAGAEITIAAIHSQIDTITNDYTLITPSIKVVATSDNHLTLGNITWS